MEVNIHHLKTPFKIATTTLGIPERYKQQCIQEVYKIGDKQEQKTNVKAIMSSYKIWEDTTILDPLLDRITNALYKIYPLKDSRLHYKLYDCWSAIYKTGHFTQPHSHLPSTMSFVYYLKADINSSPLEFNPSNFSHPVYDDLLIIFPSYVIHSVPKHEGEDRICIAGNFLSSLTPTQKPK